MAASFFNSNNDPKLANGSQFFARMIAEDPARFGLSQQQAADYVAIDAVWQAAYQAARSPSTRTKSVVVGKNVARDVMRRAASRLGQLIGAQQLVSDADKSLLGLAVRGTPTPMEAPGKPDRFASSVNVIGRLTLTWDCKNPRGSTGTIYQIYRRIGLAGELIYLGHTGERRFVDAKLPVGATNLPVSGPGRPLDRDRRDGGTQCSHLRQRRARHRRIRRHVAETRGVSEPACSRGLRRDQPSHEVSLPHPQARQRDGRQRDEADDRRVVGEVLERAVDVAEDRDAEDQVNPATDRPLRRVTHRRCPFPSKCAASTFRPARSASSTAWHRRRASGTPAVGPASTP